jgi:hypothetical protein
LPPHIAVADRLNAFNLLCHAINIRIYLLLFKQIKFNRGEK